MTDRFKEKITISKEAHYNHYRISVISIWFRIPKIWNASYHIQAQKSALVASAPYASTELLESTYISENAQTQKMTHLDCFYIQMALLFNVFPGTIKERIKGLLYETGQETENIESNNDFSLPLNYSTWNFLPSITLGQHWSLSSYFSCKLSNI